METFNICLLLFTLHWPISERSNLGEEGSALANDLRGCSPPCRGGRGGAGGTVLETMDRSGSREEDSGTRKAFYFLLIYSV